LLPYQTDTEQYWTEDFSIADEDIEFLFNVFLEEEKPLSSREIARRLIQHRIEQEGLRLRRLIERGEIFQPRNTYQVGQTLVFSGLNFRDGEIIDQRPGFNPEHGEFTVLRVQFAPGKTREFASALQTPHALNVDVLDAAAAPVIDLGAIVDRYGDDIVYLIEQRLEEEGEVVYFAGRWFLRSLLVDIGIANRNLAEAVLVVHDGGPLTTSQIMQELDLPEEVNPRLQVFSLDYALFHDERFDEVGSAGKVIWCLKEMEPSGVTTVPVQLRYEPLEYPRDLLSDELLVLEREIDDELSNLRTPPRSDGPATFSLNFPHRRAGTLALNSQLRQLFPTAYEAPRILVTLIDGQTGEEMNGWVVREHRYVYGLSDFYRRHQLPVGVYLTVERTDDPARVRIDFRAHRPRSEWLRLAVIGEDGRLRFDNQKRMIGADYDELLALGAEDLKAVDGMWMTPDRPRETLQATVRHMMGELARLSPQRTVHAKTLYSAVNIVRRCPPGPIFATLVAYPEFEHVGGPYWRLS